MSRKIAVTGASGFVGRHVVLNCLGKGYDVRCLVRNKNNMDRIPQESVEVIECSLDDSNSLRRATKGCDIVIHAAAIHTRKLNCEKEIFRVNLGGTKTLIEAIDTIDAFVFVSSIRSMMTTRTSYIDENTKYDFEKFDTPYGASKHETEKLCLSYHVSHGLPLYIINPAVVIGPDDWGPSYNGQLVHNHMTSTIAFVTKSVWNIVDVRDVAEAALFVVKNGLMAERHIVCSADMLLKDFFLNIDEVSKQKKIYIAVPNLPLRMAGHIFELIEKLSPGFDPPIVSSGAKIAKLMTRFSGDKLRKMGFIYRSAEETFSETVTWFLREIYQN